MTKPRPTNISDGSRTDAHGGDSRGELVAAVDAAQREYDAAVALVTGLQARLARLNGRVRGQRVSDSTYAATCREQGEVKQEIATAMATLAEKKRRLKALNEDLYEAGKNITKSGQRDEMVGLLTKILGELRAIRIRLDNNNG